MDSSIRPQDWTLTGSTNPGQSGIESNGNDKLGSCFNGISTLLGYSITADRGVESLRFQVSIVRR